MPFKIVQTIERGRTVLTAIPHEWESNGILLWPKKHEKLRRIENTKPDSNWQTINCVVKRTNLKSFQEAELEIDRMSNFSDTEIENDRSQITGNFSVERISNEFNIEQLNFNEIARDCHAGLQPQAVNEVTQDVEIQHIQDTVIIQDDQTIPIIKKHVAVEKNIKDSQAYIEVENCTTPPRNTTSNVIGVNETMTYILAKIDNIAEDMKTLNTEFKIITENQQALFQNQSSIIYKLTEMQTQFEEYMKQSLKSPKQNQIPDIKPVGNLKEFEELEQLLKDPDFERNLKNKLQIVCRKGKKSGTNNAYALIDVVFLRSFLNECSWAGGSKSSDTKICLKSFTKTLNLFFNIIHDSDPDFSKPDMQKFFKTVLKNSRQRVQSKQLRISTMRNRQKVKKVAKEVSFEGSTSENLLNENDSLDKAGTAKELSVSDESETGYLL